MLLLSYFSDIPYAGGRGICRLEDLCLDPETMNKVQAKCAHACSVAVVLFPYLVRDEGNLSLYARGTDYHIVVMQALESVCETLREDFPQHTFVPLVDASPLPEVKAAWVSGAGILGKNGLIFDRTYGSYVFIGTVLTDLPAQPTPTTYETCPNCGACERACPAKALDKGRVNTQACLSDLTQSKKELTVEQVQQLKQHPLIWGCDICSQVCPLNKKAKETENPAFLQNRMQNVSLEDVEGLTRKQFLAKYPNRAFTWRGPAPLVRNLSLKR